MNRRGIEPYRGEGRALVIMSAVAWGVIGALLWARLRSRMIEIPPSRRKARRYVEGKTSRSRPHRLDHQQEARKTEAIWSGRVFISVMLRRAGCPGLF